MKISSFLTKFILISTIIGTVSCQSPGPTSVPLSIDINTIQLGKADQSGLFVSSSDKTFTPQDKIILKVKATGLTISQSKVKANIDLFLKKDKEVLATQTDILGADGFTQTITGVEPTYTGSSGQADLMITIIPPSETKGELVANVTLKDLNAAGKLVTFETKFTIK